MMTKGFDVSINTAVGGMWSYVCKRPYVLGRSNILQPGQQLEQVVDTSKQVVAQTSAWRSSDWVRGYT